MTRDEALNILQAYIIGDADHEEAQAALDVIKQQPDWGDIDYILNEVNRIADEMLDTTHGITYTQKERYALYLKSITERHINTTTEEARDEKNQRATRAASKRRRKPNRKVRQMPKDDREDV